MKDVKVYIAFFGGFRKFGKGIELVIKSGSSVLEIKKSLSEELGGKDYNLAEDSVLANDDTILSDAFIINENTELSILPPVCGG